MFELAMAVCMMASPDKCKDVTLSFDGEKPSAMQCMMQGQVEMAKWVGEHPNWVITKFRCQQAGQTAKL